VESGYLEVAERSWENSVAHSAGVAKTVGCDVGGQNPDVLACLRGKKANDILYAQLAMKWAGTGPVADGYEYPINTTQRHLIKAGNFSAKPVMIGTNRNESALFLLGDADAHNMTSARMQERLAQELPSASPEQVQSLMGLYDADAYYGGDWFSAYVDVQTDASFACDSRLVADAVSSKGSRAYQYLLDRIAQQ
jgi:carboxylesterase type B